jgi:hypothetical protein
VGRGLGGSCLAVGVGVGGGICRGGSGVGRRRRRPGVTSGPTGLVKFVVCSSTEDEVNGVIIESATGQEINAEVIFTLRITFSYFGGVGYRDRQVSL